MQIQSKSSQNRPNSRVDDVEKVQEMFDKLLHICHSKGKVMRKVEYNLDSGDRIISFSVPYEDLYKRPGKLPLLARGLFFKINQDKPEIIIRGYDKFFNLQEVEATRWDNLRQNTVGPYELTLKENGCMIFITALNNDVLVTSKHAIGNRHAEVGSEWLDKHLKSVGKTRQDLSKFLSEYNVCAAFELADDDFEEHVLEYPPERRGLHLHGINENTLEFRTWTQEQIGDFPEQFGFHRVGVVVVDTMEQVKTLTDKCASTGSYQGRPIEGFVVRCRKMGHESLQEEDYFFKVKFDIPYLMYREWREVTRHMLGNKDYQPEHYRYELTFQYVEFIKEKLKTNPELFERYFQGIGQIKLRNLFLQEHGIDKPEEAAMAMTDIGRKEMEQSEGFGSNKTLLIPIGFVGCGKTTIGLALNKLYGFGHVQNDNISGKHAAERFHKEILLAFNRHDTVFADKNNQLRQHRSSLTRSIASQYPESRMIALNWNVQPAKVDEIMELSAKRIEARGENHQSLTPQRTKGYKTVIRDFLVHRDAYDKNTDADRLIDEVIEMEPTDSIQDNLMKIIRHLGLVEPTQDAIDQALEYAMNYKPTFVKHVKERKEPVIYYGVALGPPHGESIKTKLETIFSTVPEGQLDVMKEFVDRMPLSHHVTLVFCGKDKADKEETKTEKAETKTDQTKTNGEKVGEVTEKMGQVQVRKSRDETKKENADLKQKLTNIYKDLMAQHEESEEELQVKVGLNKLIWNDRILCAPVEWMHDKRGNVEAENKIPHVTLATRSADVKPYEANLLLKAISDGNTSDFYEATFPTVEFLGKIEGFRRSSQ